ncbi:MAG: hypothetical protein Udaeo2_21490 [Candidatus Udaeobacter sp.]|nr:MAG: hypothetical protein Udaeo2_21490 [Candidatus Udaeobacter sp.]
MEARLLGTRVYNAFLRFLPLRTANPGPALHGHLLKVIELSDKKGRDQPRRPRILFITPGQILTPSQAITDRPGGIAQRSVRPFPYG